MYPFSCVLWAIFWRQIARYLPHHRSENASKTHPKSSHDKFKTASKCKYVNYYDCHPPVIAASLYCSVPTSFIFGRIVRIHTETSAGRHIAYDTHVCSVLLKIEDFCVLNNTFLFGRLGQWDNVFLQQPTQTYLGCAFAVLRCNFLQLLVVQNSPVPQWPHASKTIPCFWQNSTVGAELKPGCTSI